MATNKNASQSKKVIIDNSAPWLAETNSMAEDWLIACQVNERVRLCKAQQIHSLEKLPQTTESMGSVLAL